ncbi:MAG: conjugal transfer protein [Henriciella sp.]|jgi:type IV secretion system protein VirB3|nr:VirB3 family type IV secretion system protein [Henriciella sp.]MAO81289.1 conjugal transfer protein [Nocardioides sp.]MBK74343.1 conjugal transfer protein [Henriciella sp.]|tara:strand:+ start:140 stop:394 length:255 start_codon:yes stop_codon:yes gene_type:complete
MLDGYEIPLHRSLAEPILMAGAPRSAAIAIGTLSAALALGLRLWIPGLVVWVAGHSLAVLMARSDPDFLTVAIRSARHKEHLSC